MCGIAAWLSKDRINKRQFLGMLTSLRHRGPDDAGIFMDQTRNFQVALGSRRLSILDLSEKGHQPMCYKNLNIILNGEIYNYLEIRKELQKKNYKFSSNSDTEVLLKAYHCWKEKCLNKLNGMFAFIIYDKKNETIFVARDRFGIKPLYYQIGSNDVKIASEIKAISTFRNFKSIGNKQTIEDFISNRHLDHSSNTFFKGVNQLSPGEAMVINLDNFKIKKQKWYRLSEKSYDYATKNLKDEFKDLLTDSIKLRLRSDVEVGSCLSGGLDSSSIVCIAEHLLRSSGTNKHLETFTSAFKLKRFDETNYVNDIVKQNHINSHLVYPTVLGYLNDISNLIYAQDEPIWSTSIYAQYKVFELVSKNNIKVTLDGQGGDELLGGYKNLFYKYLINNSLKNANLFRLLVMAGKLRSSFYPLLKESFDLHPKRSSAIKDVGRIIHPVEQVSSTREFSLLLFKYHLPALLHYEDRNSMAHSVEARLPFLDHRLVEFCINLPEKEKLYNNTEKVILRRAMASIVPKSITGRKDKMGFVTPQKMWMGKIRKKIQISIKELMKTELFNESYLNSAFRFAPNISTNEIMRLFTLNEWRKIYNVKSFE